MRSKTLSWRSFLNIEKLEKNTVSRIYDSIVSSWSPQVGNSEGIELLGNELSASVSYLIK